MATSTTPREAVVEIDGLWFRFQKLRGRRSFRGKRALQVCLGASGYKVIRTPSFWDASEERQLVALMACETSAGAGYDETERAHEELLSWTEDHGGQGVCYRESEADAQADGWMPVRNMGSLDNYDFVDHMTWQALRWEMIKLCYRPTSAASGTSAATPSAATTSTPASSQGGGAKPPATGAPRAETRSSGIIGG